MMDAKTNEKAKHDKKDESKAKGILYSRFMYSR